MKETKHTPTPWHVLPYQYVLNEPQRARIHGPGNEPIIDDCNPDIANAAFIIQAVNNHDALVGALKALLDHEGEREFTGIGGECDSDALENAKKQARAALAKIGANHDL